MENKDNTNTEYVILVVKTGNRIYKRMLLSGLLFFP